MNLEDFGWDDHFEAVFAPWKDAGLRAARVSLEEKERYTVLTPLGEMTAEVTGRFRHEAAGPAAYPTVGDWVAVSIDEHGTGARIHAVLPRRSNFSRKEAGLVTEEQVLAANVDTVFLVSGLDLNFNPARIERYVTAAWDSGASPVIVLNKADLCDDLEARITAVNEVAFGVPVHAVSAERESGLEELTAYLGKGKTVAFLGSSGVGKSTLINRLLGENRLKTNSVSDGDSRGRHTTTHRQLLLLPSGAMVIDTPGLRELQLWAGEASLARSFDDVEAWAKECRFRDCTHNGEPGCAVEEAVSDGSLSAQRLEHYRKLQKEIQYLESRRDDKARRREEKKRGREFSNRIKEVKQWSVKRRERG